MSGCYREACVFDFLKTLLDESKGAQWMVEYYQLEGSL